MNEFPTKSKKRAQRLYRDRKARNKRLKKLKWDNNKDVELLELSSMVGMDQQERRPRKRPRHLHTRRNEDERDGYLRDALGSSSPISGRDDSPRESKED